MRQSNPLLLSQSALNLILLGFFLPVLFQNSTSVPEHLSKPGTVYTFEDRDEISAVDLEYLIISN